MHMLQLKVPPPVIALLCALIIWACSRWLPAYSGEADIRQVIAMVLIATAMVIDLWALAIFKRVRTSIDPRYPHKTSSIVTHGIYAYTRNPMYLGLTLLLSALSIWLGTDFGLVVIIGFIFYITRFQIIPEERLLEEHFKDDYVSYKSRVRRWI